MIVKISNILLMNIVVQSVFSFPNMKIQRVNKEHSGQRMPLFAPDRCDENELLYPSEELDEWTCDCGPGFIYQPTKNTCFAIYRQGPCELGQHLILEPPRNTPACVKNPCMEGFARYKEKCYELGTPNGPCPPILEGGGIFDVNGTSLKVECLKGTDRLSLFSVPSRCLPGSKRDRNGACRVIYD